MTDSWAPPPEVLAAEEQVLGAALSVATVADEIHLTAEDFYRPQHRMIWTAIRGLSERGAPVDPISVAQALTDGDPGVARQFRLAEGHGLLHRLFSGLATAANVTFHAETVRDAARRRRLHETGIFLTQLAAGGGDVDDKLDQARERLAGVEDTGTSSARPVEELLGETLARVEAGAEPGLRTGLADLDELLGPMLPGQLLLVGARPGVGKSSLLLTIARNVAQHLHEAPEPGQVAFCSMEMGEDELTKRLIASTGVELNALMRNDLDERMWDRAARSLPILSDLPLLIDDSPRQSLSDLRALCRRETRRGLQLLIVDYAQLMAAPRAESRQVEMAAVSRGLKLLAKAAGVPLLVACQLNRKSEDRGDRRPHLSDLRESGAWEMDADVVMLLHRDDEERPGEMEVIVAKQRNGPTGVSVVGWQGPYSRVVNMTERWVREPQRGMARAY